MGYFPIQFSIYTSCRIHHVFWAWGACGLLQPFEVPILKHAHSPNKSQQILLRMSRAQFIMTIPSVLVFLQDKSWSVVLQITTPDRICFPDKQRKHTSRHERSSRDLESKDVRVTEIEGGVADWLWRWTCNQEVARLSLTTKMELFLDRP